MSSTPEGKVKKDIKKLLDEAGFWRAGAKQPDIPVAGSYYMPVQNGMGVIGIPDFVGVAWGGRRFDIEAKAPGEAPTPNQLKRHEEIVAAGGIVLVVDDVSKLAEFFNDHPPNEPWEPPCR
ncbi:VRR-NUC domain-containing protein [Paraburkholderia sp. BL10I2N1]|uniref:VRR-NUC domain-containing protein n=1 Tax=Paraburkholderia sp. BL10I2N1 TaxID=1938796 RepID=UPI001061B39E|nr:VRR-NUC domain-containing protein [Paraburkholderia sp. BL10I2N1]TDN70478.1 hypothetical protein B0G77_3952 [Paraburkholderia sp. BL10I2N1]